MVSGLFRKVQERHIQQKELGRARGYRSQMTTVAGHFQQSLLELTTRLERSAIVTIIYCALFSMNGLLYLLYTGHLVLSLLSFSYVVVHCENMYSTDDLSLSISSFCFFF